MQRSDGAPATFTPPRMRWQLLWPRPVRGRERERERERGGERGREGEGGGGGVGDCVSRSLCVWERQYGI